MSKMIKRCHYVSMVLLLMVSMGVALSQSKLLYAEDDSERLMVQNKLKLAKYILTQSDMTKNVMDSSNQGGINLIHEARRDFSRAKSLFESNNITQADTILTRLLQSLASLSNRNKKKMPDVSSEIEYKKLVTTITTLTSAMQKELDQVKNSEKLNSVKLDNILKTADTLAMEGRYSQANKLLSEVYYNLKLFIKQQRNNKTIVYALDFKNKQDEYEYEIKRYKSFSMIMEMSLQKKNIPEQTLSLVDRYKVQANIANKKATDLAKTKQYTEAIKVQEQASQQLIRALRMIGLTMF